MTSWSGMGIASSKPKINILAYFAPAMLVRDPISVRLSRHHPAWKTRPAHLVQGLAIVWTLRLAHPQSLSIWCQVSSGIKSFSRQYIYIGLGHAFNSVPASRSLTGQAKLKGSTMRLRSLPRLALRLKVLPPMTGVDPEPKLQGPPAVTRD